MGKIICFEKITLQMKKKMISKEMLRKMFPKFPKLFTVYYIWFILISEMALFFSKSLKKLNLVKYKISDF